MTFSTIDKRTFFLSFSGICWSIAYCLIIYVGFKDGFYGMPAAALCANLCWEFIFGYIRPHEPPQKRVNQLWFLLDIPILLQLVLFGPKEYTTIPAILFYFLLVVGIILSYLIILYTVDEFDDEHGRYAAFGQNLMMSILFVFLILHRGSLEGQSIYIAILKCIGTLAPAYLFYTRFPKSKLLNSFYVGIIIFDVLYIGLILYVASIQGINPWLQLF